MIPGPVVVMDELRDDQRSASSVNKANMTTGVTGVPTQVDELLDMDIE